MNLQKNLILDVTNGFMYAFCFYSIMPLYAYFENVNFYIISNFRFLDRYYNAFNKYFINFFKTKLKKYTTDVFIKYEYDAYTSMKKYGYLNEVIGSRLSSKNRIVKYIYDSNDDIMNNLRRYDMENRFRNKMSTYVDEYAFFDDCGKNEVFLNDRCDYCPIVEDLYEPDTKEYQPHTSNIQKVTDKNTTYINYEKLHEESYSQETQSDNTDDEKDNDLPDTELMITRLQ